MTIRLAPLVGLLSLPLLFSAPSATASTTPAPAPPAQPDLPAAQRVLLFVNGAERYVAPEAAIHDGYTLVDLSDGFVPFIFREVTDATGNVLSNRYKRVYLGLANDTGDGDGQPLGAGAHNYLELYGVPPTLTVLQARFLADEPNSACAGVDFDKLRGAPSIPPRESKAQAKMVAKIAVEKKQLEKQRVAAGVDTLEALAQTTTNPATAKMVTEVQLFAAEQLAFPEVEKRFVCEGLLVAPGTPVKRGDRHERHVFGQFDEALRTAIIAFQHKHMLYDAAALRKQTMLTLGKPLLDNDYAAFLRVLTERVVSAAGILEDGSVEGQYTNGAGQSVPIRNLVGESMTALLQQTGWSTPADVVAFFKRHPVDECNTLKVGFKLPAVP